MNCELCGREITDVRKQCSAHPVLNDGKCCHVCDDLIVTPVRILITSGPPTVTEILAVFRNAVRTHHIVQAERRRHAEAQTRKTGQG